MLPIVAGPILLIVLLDHGPAFTADVARATTLGIASLAALAVAQGRRAAGPTGGHGAVLALLRGIVPGPDGFAFLLAVTVNRFPPVVSSGLATAAAVAVALVLVWRRPRGVGAP